ncbi:MAG: hypothetical protein GWM90_32950, partial [Gemmatimonadetes bacterium]|nr:hypothetical protein [Gemmatimonadota bacterium]NIQ54713.1 hypothetical protein [Gemmatimonadota bacterium]NIU74918.1 hypothetical protein [Gammaproteobacteria bacterium]NIX48693.1 hypothetical protein [Gemmatimonadota bacterium]NIY09038.1 hypothetical protein [Gemmatimonadota bacterium]
MPRTFRKLIVELHRRSIWQVLGIYVVGAWVSYEVVLGLTEGLGLPTWVPPTAIVLFVIGLPIVLATAFVQEGLPGQDRADTGRDGEGSSTADAHPPPTGPPDRAAAGAGGVAASGPVAAPAASPPASSGRSTP